MKSVIAQKRETLPILEPTAQVEYSFTKNTHLLAQYGRIKNELYSNEFLEYEKEFDTLSTILVAQVRGRCVGGARIICSTTTEHKIPIESDGFSLSAALPEISIRELKYCEFSRLVLLPQYQTGYHSLEMLRLMTTEAISMGCSFIFGEATLSKARRYRMIYNKIGLKMTIREDIKTPDRRIYSHYDSKLSLYLIYVDLRQVSYQEQVAA